MAAPSHLGLRLRHSLACSYFLYSAPPFLSVWSACTVTTGPRASASVAGWTQQLCGQSVLFSSFLRFDLLVCFLHPFPKWLKTLARRQLQLMLASRDETMPGSGYDSPNPPPHLACLLPVHAESQAPSGACKVNGFSSTWEGTCSCPWACSWSTGIHTQVSKTRNNNWGSTLRRPKHLSWLGIKTFHCLIVSEEHGGFQRSQQAVSKVCHGN